MKRNRLLAHVLTIAMAVSVLSGVTLVSDTAAAAKAPKLSATKKSLDVGKSFTLKIKSNGTKIAKTTWKSGKKAVAATSKAKKTSVKVTAKSAGKAKITATVKFKAGNKNSKKKLTCTVTVNAPAADSNQSQNPSGQQQQPAQQQPAQQQPDNPNGGNDQPEPTEEPTPRPDYYKYDYFAIYDASKSSSQDNFYVNFILSDSWSTNVNLGAIQSVDLQIDSEDSFTIDLYASGWECDASRATKLDTITTNGTEGQEITVNLNGKLNGINRSRNGGISFGFKPAAGSGRFILHDMYVNYNDSNLSNMGGKAHHKAAISVKTCSLASATNAYNSAKAADENYGGILQDFVDQAPEGLFLTRPRDASDAINGYDRFCEITEAKGYKFGTCVTYDLIKNDPEFCKLLAYHCDSITAMNEFKAYSLLDEQATLANYKNDNESMPCMKYEKADFLCDWAVANNIKVRGHALVWDNAMEQNHKWFFTQGYNQNGQYASNDICRKRLKYYVDQVMRHFQEKYPDTVYCWDVVNEGIDEGSSDRLKIRQNRGGANPFYYHCSSGNNGSGENYVRFTFQCAYDTREAMINEGLLDDRSKIELVYNDYNVIEDSKRPYVEALVKDLNSGSEQLVDCVGCQGYLGDYQKQGSCLEDQWWQKPVKTIKIFAEMNPPVHVQLTEMAMRNFEWSRLPEHGDFAAKLFQNLANINEETNNSFTSMSIWAFIDNPIANNVDESFDYWQYAPFSGMFDDVYRPKPAFENAYNLLRQ